MIYAVAISYVIKRGLKMENQDILDFANMVFSMEYGSIDFEELYPKAYSGECCHIPIHHTIFEEGKLRALLDVYPVTMQFSDSEKNIKAAYIGTVAVHPKARGKGYMTQLMKQAQDDAVQKGFDLMLVDGDRHRYCRYGFEKAGMKYNFNVRLNNARNCCDELYVGRAFDALKYCFEEIDEGSEHISFLYELYTKRAVTARTKENFFLCLKSNLAVTYVIFDERKPVGYINTSCDGRNILEFELEDSVFIPRVMYDFMREMMLDEVGITIGADETKKIDMLEKMSDYYNMAMSHMMKILKPEKVLSFLVEWKKKYDTNVISADDVYKLWRELEMDDREKVGLLTTFRCYMEAQKGMNNRLKTVSINGLPLPFFLPDADAF